MASKAPSKSSVAADRAEKELLTILAHERSCYPEIEALISKYRSACETFLFADFEAAVTTKKTDTRLWSAHGKVNSRYRSSLAKYHGGNGKKKPVERRKLEKDYLSFIKSSTRFYRGYVQRLASHFQGPREVLEVAQKLHLDTLSADLPIQPSQQWEKLILDSCHTTLVRLGDLSRYRETEITTKERNWRPAKGYYDLATAIKPSSGTSHNQLAVIARADGDHLGALYHLYRALTAEDPHPMAHDNLQTELKKLLDPKNQCLLNPPEPDMEPITMLRTWFVYLHARLNAGVSFPQHEELENDILTSLSVELKERPLSDLLNKFVLSSIAAQHLTRSQEGKDAPEGSAQTFIFFLRFNIKTFFTLLQILLSELETLVVENEEQSTGPLSNTAPSGISATVRRIAPCLRQYSCWLVSNASQLLAAENHELVCVHLTEFWRIYANALTLLAATFRPSELPDMEYLLEEDEDTIAFTPFTHSNICRRYIQPGGVSLKPRSQSNNVQRQHPNLEMLFRIKGLLEDGIALVRLKMESNGTSVPLMIVDNSRFEFQEQGLPPEANYHKGHAHSQSSTTINRDDIERAKRDSKTLCGPTEANEDAPESIAASISTSTAMHQMVNGLVASEVSEDHEPASNFPQISQGDYPPTPSTPEDRENRAGECPERGTESPAERPIHQHQNICATLPSIWNSPFAPRPCETESPDARPRTAYRLTPATAEPTADHAPKSSNTRFQENLQRQRQELETHLQSSIIEPPPSSTTSLSYPNPSPTPKSNFAPEETSSSPIPSPFGIPSSSPSANFPSYDVPRRVPKQPRFGAVGQLPPSAQRGGWS